jgi:lipopolysaccharide transport system permease protein
MATNTYSRKHTRGKKMGIAYLRDLMWVLVSREFKLRYKRSLLGVAWSLLVPMAQLGVLYVVFSYMLQLNIPHFSIFLLTGILPWTWFSGALTAASSAIVDNRELVKQVNFPVGVLPAVSVLSQMVHFVLALPILAGFLLAEGFRPTLPLISLPIVMLIQLLLLLGLSYILATLQVRFRDTQYLLGIFLFLFFYVTPVFWDANRIQEPFRTIMLANPLASLLGAYRSIFMDGRWPSLVPMALLAVTSAALCSVCYVLFKRSRDRFVEEL